MKESKATVEQVKPGSLKIVVEGRLSEEVEMPMPDLDGVSELLFDLEGVAYINSAGVKNWMTWIAEREKKFPNVALSYQHVPLVISKQMFAIAGFLPKDAKVVSMSAHFYCEDCDATTKRLINTREILASGKDQAALREDLEKVPCTSCGAVAMIDDDPESFCKVIMQHGCKP